MEKSVNSDNKENLKISPSDTSNMDDRKESYRAWEELDKKQ